MILNIQRMKLDLGCNIQEQGNLKQCLVNLESGEDKVENEEDSTINQEQEAIMDVQEAEIDAHFIGQTVGLFRGYVGADNCSAVNLKTVIQD